MMPRVAAGCVPFSPLRGAPLSDDAIYGYARLEQAIEALLQAHERLRGENERLTAALEASAKQVGELEAELEEQERRRSEARQRIDALVATLDQLDARLERAEESRSSEAAAPAGGTAR